MRIGLLGMGTIGSGVYEIVAKRADMEIARVLDLRPIPGLGGKLTTRFEDILEDKTIDTVVELMGGLEPAHEFVVRALRAGKSVVTANKLMLSHHYAEVAQAAHDSGAGVRVSASVGGGIPYLHNLLRARRVDAIKWVGGILNGTTNLILDTMQTSGAGFDEVLREAQRLGYAEADPSSDIDGIDARSKITISMNVAFGGVADTREVPTEGIRRLTGADVEQFAKLGRVCRFLARAERFADGAVGACVEPVLVEKDAVEAAVRKNDNIISFEGEYVGVQHFFGQGAGKFPTAYAVVEDLRDVMGHPGRSHLRAGEPALKMDNRRATKRYYLRTAAPVEIEAEALGSVENGAAWLTAPVNTQDMHALAARLRHIDDTTFFAALR